MTNKQEKRPLITIGILAFNTEIYIERCLYSVYQQNYKNIELIIAYTESKDNTYGVLQEVLKYSPFQYKVIKSGENQMGPGPSRNIILKEGVGDYLFFLDSDDTINENCLNTLLENSLTHNLDLVCGSHVSISEDGKLLKEFKFSETRIFDGEDLLEYIHLNMNSFPIYCWNKLYKYHLLREAKIVFTQNFAEDELFVHKVLLNADRSMIVNSVTLNYLIRSDSLTKKTQLDKTNILTAKAYLEIRDYKFLKPTKSNILHHAIVIDTFFNFFVLANRDILRSSIINDNDKLQFQNYSFESPNISMRNFFRLGVLKPLKTSLYIFAKIIPNSFVRLVIAFYHWRKS
jgi:glycosyltransferase involved in cell wall biosynthesis